MRMRRSLGLAAALIVGLVGASAAPAAAITGGQPDGEGHPYGALLLVPGIGFCSGTLIAPDVVLTAGHCTYIWSNPPEGIGPIDTVMVSFAAQAEVDENWNPVNPADWHPASSWITHPGFVPEQWPFTFDYGLMYLDNPVAVTPAALPDVGLVEDLIGDHGQTAYRFNDVGYGQDGVINGDGRPIPNFPFTLNVATERYAPGTGSFGGDHFAAWFITQSTPSSEHGGPCGGDSGSGVFPADNESIGDTVIAVHTGNYKLGVEGAICGRNTALNHRVDLPEVLDWIADHD